MKIVGWRRGGEIGVRVSHLVGILSRVNHKGLHHGQKQCSICLLLSLNESHQTTNYPNKKHKIGPDIIPPKKTNKHKHQTQNVRGISPLGIAPVKKAHKARTRWCRGPFR